MAETARPPPLPRKKEVAGRACPPGNNNFRKNISFRLAFGKKSDYNKLFSMFGTTI